MPYMLFLKKTIQNVSAASLHSNIVLMKKQDLHSKTVTAISTAKHPLPIPFLMAYKKQVLPNSILISRQEKWNGLRAPMCGRTILKNHHKVIFRKEIILSILLVYLYRIYGWPITG